MNIYHLEYSPIMAADEGHLQTRCYISLFQYLAYQQQWVLNPRRVALLPRLDRLAQCFFYGRWFSIHRRHDNVKFTDIDRNWTK